MIKNGEKYLITTDNWFFAPDGEQYRAIWGTCNFSKTDEVLGFNPTRSTNWLLKVGEGEGAMTLGGCQVNYAIACVNRPKLKEQTYNDKETGLECISNRIYIP